MKIAPIRIVAILLTMVTAACGSAEDDVTDLGSTEGANTQAAPAGRLAGYSLTITKEITLTPMGNRFESPPMVVDNALRYSGDGTRAAGRCTFRHVPAQGETNDGDRVIGKGDVYRVKAVSDTGPEKASIEFVNVGGVDDGDEADFTLECYEIISNVHVDLTLEKKR